MLEKLFWFLKSDREWRVLGIVIWIILVAFSGLVFYVNHYLPHGPMYATGDVVCQDDNQGQCGPGYKEDLSLVNIPAWAKDVREYWLLPWIGLILLGGLASGRPKGGYTASGS